MNAVGHAPWFVGQAVDHLYATCPGLLRGLAGRRPEPAPGVIYPEAGDVCGVCLRYWRARTVTAGELDALRCTAAGHTYARTGRLLGVSEAAVSSRLRSAARKLSAPNATAAVVAALKRGLIALDEIDVPGAGRGSVAEPRQIREL